MTTSQATVTGLPECCWGKVNSGGGITRRYTSVSGMLWSDAS